MKNSQASTKLKFSLEEKHLEQIYKFIDGFGHLSPEINLPVELKREQTVPVGYCQNVDWKALIIIKNSSLGNNARSFEKQI